MKRRLMTFVITALLVAGMTVPAYAAKAATPAQYRSAKETGFAYTHSPMENSYISKDIVVNPDAIYGYAPNPASKKMEAYVAFDWTDAAKVAEARAARVAAYKAKTAALDPALDACLGLYDDYFTPYVAAGLADGYSAEDKAYVAGWGDNTPDEVLWAEYEDVYRNPTYYDSKTGDINWPANDGFWGDSFEYTLKPYTVIDRYGSDYGTFVSLIGHPYEDYSLAPGSEYKNYSVFVVRKPIKGQAGSVYPWFDEPGRATQFVLPAKVKDLLADGSLERVVYR